MLNGVLLWRRVTRDSRMNLCAELDLLHHSIRGDSGRPPATSTTDRPRSSGPSATAARARSTACSPAMGFTSSAAGTRKNSASRSACAPCGVTAMTYTLKHEADMTTTRLDDRGRRWPEDSPMLRVSFCRYSRVSHGGHERQWSGLPLSVLRTLAHSGLCPCCLA